MEVQITARQPFVLSRVFPLEIVILVLEHFTKDDEAPRGTSIGPTRNPWKFICPLLPYFEGTGLYEEAKAASLRVNTIRASHIDTLLRSEPRQFGHVRKLIWSPSDNLELNWTGVIKEVPGAYLLRMCRNLTQIQFHVTISRTFDLFGLQSHHHLYHHHHLPHNYYQSSPQQVNTDLTPHITPLLNQDFIKTILAHTKLRHIRVIWRRDFCHWYYCYWQCPQRLPVLIAALKEVCKQIVAHLSQKSGKPIRLELICGDARSEHAQALEESHLYLSEGVWESIGTWYPVQRYREMLEAKA